ncbi:MAG TPA: biotin/lipoyl-containing protein, partial [Candidatus Dormibacteraeota bacterium]|nr:biotin/lipoyl-containing protein [Candidatus Dormibacteraeota bacterium]
MLTELRLPDLGEGVAEGEVVEWLVAVGDTVDEDTPLVEVMTDKATVQIPSPVAGTVASLEVAAGRVVAVGTVLLRIAAGDVEPAASTARANDVAALPSTRRLARDLGVDLVTLEPEAATGRVGDGEVRRAASPRAAPPGRRIPLAGRRRAIAEHLTRAA